MAIYNIQKAGSFSKKKMQTVVTDMATMDARDIMRVVKAIVIPSVKKTMPETGLTAKKTPILDETPLPPANFMKIE